MKNKGLIPVALMALMSLTLVACNNVVELSDAKLNATKLVDFKDGANPDVLFESDGWSNGDVFNVVWKKSNVHYENGIMRLGITEEKAFAYLDDEEVEFKYTAGEARTTYYYGYGDYEVSMKPSKNQGTASTFFTCTGPYDTKLVLDDNGDHVLDENGQPVSVNNPHDEIDIEFLGKDTTKVQFNFFVDGKGGNEYMYDLGFDASKEFHEYGYRWAKDSITWFVDDKPVYKVTTDKTVKTADNVRYVEKLPSTPGRILTNYWCGNERAHAWMGAYDGAKNDQGTEYQWMATSAVGSPLNPEEKPNTDHELIDWSSIDPVTPTFASTDKYTVTTEGTSSNIAYTDVNGSSYINVEMDIANESSDNNYVYLRVKNNGTETSQVRVNVVDSELVAAGAQNMATNVSATMDGNTVFTDLVWGGSFFELPAGQTSEFVINYNGVVEKLQLMLDSSRNNSDNYSGNVTVEAIKFAKLGDIVVPEVPGGDTPAADEYTFSAEADTGYTITSLENNAVNLKYNGAGNTYKPVTAAVAEKALNNNTFTVTIRNNASTDSRVRVDVQGTTWVATGDGSGTDACNVTATGGDVWTDLTWGGSALTVAANSEVTLVVTYDGNGEHGPVKNILVFVDSARGDDATYNSDITLSNMSFTNVGGASQEGTALTFYSEENSGYTVSALENNEVNLKYDGVGNTYKPVTAAVAEKALNNNTFTVTIRNNASTDSRVRVDVQGTTWVATGDGSGTDACNVTATGGDVWTDLTWGGSALTVAANSEVTLVVTYDGNSEQGPVKNILVFVDSARGDANTYNSDITLSNMSFTNVL